MTAPVPRIDGDDPKTLADIRAGELAGIRSHFPGATIEVTGEVTPDGETWTWTADHGCGQVHEEAGMGALHVALRRCGGGQ